MVNYASNHILDGEAAGVTRTLKVTKESGLDVIGLRETSKDKKYIIKEVKGHKIGIIAYVFETATKGKSKTINSIEIPSEIKGLINTFNYDDLNTLFKDLEENIALMKAEGAEFIITSMHWGEEYDSKENKKQSEISQELSNLGVNIILGGHPHVVQPYQMIKNSKGEETFVSYSQGNFLSNQCSEEIQDERTEDGVVINFTLNINKEGSLKLKEYELIPTWIYREEKGKDLYTHRIIPLDEAKETFMLTEEATKRTEESLKRTEGLIDK